MKFKSLSLFNLLAIASAMTISGSAFATYSGSSSTWSYGDDDKCYQDCFGSNYGGDWGYTYDKNDSNKDVHVSSWSKNSDGKLGKKKTYRDDSGYGSKEHDMDDDYVDSYGGMDSVLYDYGDKCVVLDSVTISKKYNSWDGSAKDSDMTVFAYVGDEAWKKEGKTIGDYLAGKSYAELETDKDWVSYQVSYDSGNKLDGDYDGSGGYKKSFISDKNGDNKIDDNDYTASKYWIVKAGKHSTDNNDYFKVKHMGGHDYDGKTGCYKKIIICDKPNGDVPEPAPLALMALGLIGLGYTRRRQLKK